MWHIYSPVIEAESPLHLVYGYTFCHAAHVLVERASDKIEVAKYERLLHIKPYSNDVQGVLFRISPGIVYIDLGGMHILFIVSEHNHERDVKNIL